MIDITEKDSEEKPSTCLLPVSLHVAAAHTGYKWQVNNENLWFSCPLVQSTGNSEVFEVTSGLNERCALRDAVVS